MHARSQKVVPLVSISSNTDGWRREATSRRHCRLAPWKCRIYQQKPTSSSVEENVLEWNECKKSGRFAKPVARYRNVSEPIKKKTRGFCLWRNRTPRSFENVPAT